MINICNIVPIQYLPIVRGRSHHLILAHLVKKNEIYRNFYKEEAKRGATIILDNSSFERGDNWATPQELLDIYYSLESDNVFLMAPEVAFDGAATASAIDTFKKIVPQNILLFGTVHGSYYYDVSMCYYRVQQLVDLIGFSYRIWCPSLHISYPNKTTEQGLMRINLINHLVRDGCINKQKKHHLLGISDILEIAGQSQYDFITSADSSTCYIHAREKIHFSEVLQGGFTRTRKSIHFDEPYDEIVVGILKNNITVLDKLGEGRII